MGSLPNAPVRVLAVTRPSRAWGAQLWLLMVAPALGARGVEVTLCVPSDNPMAERWAAAGLALVPWNGPQAGVPRRRDGSRAGLLGIAVELWRAVVAAVRLVPIARRHDVVLSYSRHTHLEAVLAGKLARRPVVMDVVDIVEPGLGRRGLQLCARFADSVVVNSRATAATLGSAARHMHLVYPGTDVERFHPGPADPEMRSRLGARPGAPLVGIVGRLDPKKRIELVAEALSRGGDGGPFPALAHATLAVVGDRGIAPESYVEELRARVRTLLGERVCFAGRIEDVPAVLRSLDVLVNASAAEPFGLSVLEAQACGTPVVAAAGGGILDFVIDGETGVLFPPGEPDGLASGLQRVLGDEELTRAMTKEARERAVERFDANQRYDELAAIYRSAVRDRRSRRRRDPTPAF